jgi:hypothetical protein
MPPLLQDKPGVLFEHDGASSHIQSASQHSRIGSCLSDGSAKEGSLPGLCSFQIQYPSTFSWGVLWKLGLCSASAYKPELEGSNMSSDCKNWLAFLAECLAWIQILSWWVQGTNWSTYWTCIGYKKGFLSCSLHWCVFKFCVTITFLTINLCSCSHHL